MKVYELMAALQHAPGGMEIRIACRNYEANFGYVVEVDQDGTDADGTFTISFVDDNPENE